MRVKFLQSIAGNGSPDGRQYPQFYFAEGFVGDIVDDTLAQAWIDSGICVAAELGDKPRPPKPELAVPVPVEKAVMAKGKSREKVVVPAAPVVANDGTTSAETAD